MRVVGPCPTVIPGVVGWCDGAGKMSKHPPAPTASAVGPCPTVIQIVGRPGTGSLPRPSHHPSLPPPPGTGFGWLVALGFTAL